MNKDAKQAMDLINKKLVSSKVDNNSLLKGHRIDQRKDFTKKSIKIIFNEKTSKKLLNMVKKVLETDFAEYGTYFYGNVYDDFIYIDDVYSDFQLSDGLYENGAVEVTEQNLKELDMKTERSLTENPCNVVMHFHTHPDHVQDKRGNILTPASSLMSEQDLYSYGYHQLYLQPTSKNPVLYIGGMLAKNYNKPQFNIVFYDIERQCFYNLNNIYLVQNQELIKVDNYNFINSKVLPLNIKEDTKIKILQLIKQDNNRM